MTRRFNYRRAAVTAAAMGLTACAAASPAGTPAWHYEGTEGPAHWATLSPAFAACGNGRSQSPIDISGPVAEPAPERRSAFPPVRLQVVHQAHAADEINNGHTIEVDYAGADTLTLGGVDYGLVQYHFHAPSEHTVQGKHFPMEMHMVHKSSDGKLAVVGVLIEAGTHNAAFDPVWAHLPTQEGVRVHVPDINVDVDALLPATRTSYRYEGSLTTPPCSEGVSWIVMTTPIQLSDAQIAAFTHLVHDNSRPVQMLNGRTILTDPVSLTASGGTGATSPR